jgi:hypothetical protein
MAGDLISREALERIIQRAAELQADERDIGEGLTRDEVLALGKDVGIPARYLHQALLAEETRAVGEAGGGGGPLAWLFGPAALTATRVAPGDPPGVERALAAWLEQEELLQVKRRYPDHTTWEPKAGALASIQRALGAGGKRFALAQAAEIAGSVASLESGFCHVQLRADIGNLRRQRLAGAAALFGFGTLATALAPVLGTLFPWMLLPVAILAVAAAGYARGHRRDNDRVQVGLEQLLDRLERGETRPEHRLAGPGVGALGRIADELRALMNPGASPRG